SINKAIANGSFFENKAFLSVLEKVQKEKSNLHLMGLVSDGNIHASQDHLYALLDLCKKHNLSQQVFVHVILDGRDTSRDAGLVFISKLETKMQELGVGKIATLAGRFYAMDRDNRWDRTEKAYRAIRYGQAERMSDSPLKALEQSYEKKVYDEEFPPTVIMEEDGTPRSTIGDNDGMIFFNFRADRARQLTKAFVLPGFQKFDIGAQLKNLSFISMTEYEKNLPLKIAFQQDTIKFPIARVIADNNLHQLHIAETEKYAHVTLFLNGGAEEAFKNEERALIPSPRVAAYNETPAMSVVKVADRILVELSKNKFQFIAANFANVDMVGHTGDLAATIAAVESVDKEIGRLAEQIETMNATMIITADHGNAEEMIDQQTGEIMKEHTTNPVPFIMVNSWLKKQRTLWPKVTEGDLSRMQPIGVLSDAAPTILKLMGLSIPQDMTSQSLIR
ncbi:MAG: phosphoglycerate mutase (2,3-diphosphoglycerate-independent), partial [Candidatus Kerfeldbacteria bacterium RIFOXYC2_FULL_38_9]